MAWERPSTPIAAWGRPPASPIEVIHGGRGVGYAKTVTPVLPDDGFEGIDWGDKYIISFSPYLSELAYNEYQVTPQGGSLLDDPEWTFVAENPNVATIDSSGRISRNGAASGYAFFRVESERLKICDRFKLIIGDSGDSIGSAIPEPVLEGYKPGTLGAALTSTLTANISGKSPSASNTQVYSVVPSNSDYIDWHDSKTGITYPKTKGGVDEFARNTSTDFIGHGIDLTAVSPGWKKSGESLIRRTQTATLISPRCFLSCNHGGYWPDEGGEVLFVDNSNNVHTATVLDTTHVGSDIQVGLLDADIPSDITPLKFISENALLTKTTRWHAGNPGWSTYRLSHVPLLAFTQHELLMPAEDAPKSFYGGLSFWPAFVSNMRMPEWLLRIYTGDSGNPVCMVLDGELIACTQFYYPNLGPSLLIYQSLIQDGMNELSSRNNVPSQSLIYADVSAYPDITQI